ncbi:subtilisin isoform X2 [Folsomia candida]|uniref:subtilisin isoform X2 n=1 Tax=Folsomia candida TaxID=158441 RepID=UPI000B8F3E1F|nr:subtilisin isoform X2 [Folsomia candida]
MKLLIFLAASLTAAHAGTVDPALLDPVEHKGETEAILELPQIMGQVEANQALQSLTGDAKVSALITTLKGLTSAAQAPFISIAASLGLTTEPYWASNIILVKGLTPDKLASLASTPGEFTLRAQNIATIPPQETGAEFNADMNQNTPQLGVAQIRAPVAWANNITGEGVVVGIIDTGVNNAHVAFNQSFAGVWLDPYYNRPGPSDQQGHGTRCAGIIFGRENGVGVAPGARYVACSGLNHQGSGPEAVIIRCAQYLMTETPRPHIINNSWGGGSNNTWFNAAISAWRNAGIIPVFPVGSWASSATCRSAISPGDQPNVISVGATTEIDARSIDSARGPSLDGLLKPEVSAPGSNIVSCGAGPHVSGAIALILSAHPTWIFDEIYNALAKSAAHPTLSSEDRTCGFPGPHDYPNYSFGYGRIDVAAALGL